MIGRPEPSEFAPYYATYIDRVPGDDPLPIIESQLDETLAFLNSISEGQSQHRYAPDKWSIKQVLNHVTDTERAFSFRALWFARGFEAALPGYDQNIGAAGAGADDVSWSALVEELRLVRLSSISLFRNMPAAAWTRTGVASGNPFSVRAVAFILAGHVIYHEAILRERYLEQK